MNKYPSINPLYKKEMDRAIEILEAIEEYKTSLSVELMKKYCREYLKELERFMYKNATVNVNKYMREISND